MFCIDVFDCWFYTSSLLIHISFVTGTSKTTICKPHSVNKSSHCPRDTNRWHVGCTRSPPTKLKPCMPETIRMDSSVLFLIHVQFKLFKFPVILFDLLEDSTCVRCVFEKPVWHYQRVAKTIKRGGQYKKKQGNYV